MSKTFNISKSHFVWMSPHCVTLLKNIQKVSSLDMLLIFTMLCLGKSFPHQKVEHMSHRQTWYELKTQTQDSQPAVLLRSYFWASAAKTIRKYQADYYSNQWYSPLIKLQKQSETCTGSVFTRCQRKETDSRFCVIKALLLEHMLAQTNIHARHNLAIRRSF